MYPVPPNDNFLTAVIIQGKHPKTNAEFAVGGFVFVSVDEWHSDSEVVTIFEPPSQEQIVSSVESDDTPRMYGWTAHKDQLRLVAGIMDLDEEMPSHLSKTATVSDILNYYLPTQPHRGLELEILRKFEQGVRNGST